jgi:tRNA-2-methylthio-N6-dimethylallyladenosine synthase
MNRKYSREEYIDKIKMIRSIIPNVSITSDVIVGYPLERDANFAETVSLLEECRLDNVYSFKYSPREGTVAYKTLKDNISKEKKEERLALLNKVEAKISKEINESLINTNQEVLWENIKIYQSEKLLEGRTRTYKKVFAPFRENRVGELDFVKITKSTNYSLIGEIVKS